MTALASPSTQDAPPLIGWESDVAWRRRLERDRRQADRCQSAAQRAITAQLRDRADALGVQAFALTGSTVRGCRTEISDLDYHVVGPRPRYTDLPDDVDIYATDADTFWAKLRAGDDYIQWTLRLGCVLFDRTGIFRDGMRVLATEGIWPDTALKRSRLPAHRSHAERLIVVGDRDAAQDQVRAALTSAARATLLDEGIFALARSELPRQLREVGHDLLADGLDETIHGYPTLEALERHLAALDAVIAWSGNQRHVVSNGRSWDVVRPGSARVSSRHRTQREAVTRARQIVGNAGGGQVVVHGRDGSVRERGTVVRRSAPAG